MGKILKLLAVIVATVWGNVVTLTKVEGTQEGVVSPIVPKGETGYILCPYMGKEIICGLALSEGEGRVRFEVYDNLKNRAMALPVVLPKPGDKVVFQKNYRRVLIIAPNSEIYFSLLNRYRKEGNTPISSDFLAIFEEDEGVPSREDLISLAKKMDIGRYAIVTPEGVIELDALSLQKLRSYPCNCGPIHYKVPFFTSYNDWEEPEEGILERYNEELKLDLSEYKRKGADDK
jgi:hypothetical protein